MLNETYRAMLGNKSVIRETFMYGKQRAAEIGYENVFDYSLGNPSVPCPQEFTAAMQDLLVYVGNVLRLMCYDAREQTIRDVTTRLIHFLLLYTQGKEVPEVDCSQQQIASAINASRVQVTRVCARLQAQGLIRIRRGHIRILDPETLEQLSERREAGERE